MSTFDALMRRYGEQRSPALARGRGMPVDVLWRYRGVLALAPTNNEKKVDATLQEGQIYWLKARVEPVWYRFDGGTAVEDGNGTLVLDAGEWTMHVGEGQKISYVAASTSTGDARLYLARLELAR